MSCANTPGLKTKSDWLHERQVAYNERSECSKQIIKPNFYSLLIWFLKIIIIAPTNAQCHLVKDCFWMDFSPLGECLRKIYIAVLMYLQICFSLLRLLKSNC